MTAILKNSASKVEETQYLVDFVASLGDQTYLISMFSQELVQWAKSRIRDDMGMDIYGTLQEQERENQKQRADIAQLQSQLSAMTLDRNATVNAYRLQSNELVTEREMNEAQVSDLKRVIDNQNQSFEELLNRKDEAEAEATEQVAKLMVKIQALKAEIYDLEHKES